MSVVITGWSLNIRWGSSTAVGNGPPGQWERHIVGALLLAGVSALFLFFVRTGGKGSFSRPAAVSLAASAGALAIAVFLRFNASSTGFPDLVEGPGWSWMAAGCGLSTGCAIGALTTSMRSRPAPAAKAGTQKKRKRK